MQRRYEPSPDFREQNRCKPTNSGNPHPQRPQPKNCHTPPATPPPPPPPKKPPPKNFVSGLIPPSLFNPETHKVLGRFSTEDILIAALILLLLDSGEKEDNILVYLLLYILLSDYIDIPFDL